MPFYPKFRIRSPTRPARRPFGRAVDGGLRPRGVGRRVLGGPGRPRPGRVERHSGRERSLPEGLAEGAARETGLYLLGIERRAAGRSLLRRRAVHEAFRHGSGREWGIGASAPFVAGFLSAPAFAGALIAPKKHDLQGVASRAFLHVAAVHPLALRGRAVFSLGVRPGCGFTRPLSEFELSAT